MDGTRGLFGVLTVSGMFPQVSRGTLEPEQRSRNAHPVASCSVVLDADHGLAGGAAGDDHGALAGVDDHAYVAGMVRAGAGSGVEEHQVAGLLGAFADADAERPLLEGRPR